jgi:hypothetical protein
MDSDDPGAETANLLLTQADSGNPALPPLKELLLDKQFPNARQTVKLGQPRNIFASLEEQAAKLASRNSTQTKSMEHSNTSQAAEPPPPTPSSPRPFTGGVGRPTCPPGTESIPLFGISKKRRGKSGLYLKWPGHLYREAGEILEGRIQVNKIEPETVILSTKVWETGSSIQASISLTPDTRS